MRSGYKRNWSRSANQYPKPILVNSCDTFEWETVTSVFSLLRCGHKISIIRFKALSHGRKISPEKKIFLRGYIFFPHQDLESRNVSTFFGPQLDLMPANGKALRKQQLSPYPKNLPAAPRLTEKAVRNPSGGTQAEAADTNGNLLLCFLFLCFQTPIRSTAGRVIFSSFRRSPKPRGRNRRKKLY